MYEHRSFWTCLAAVAAIGVGVAAARAAPLEACGTVIVPTSLGAGSSATITSFNPLFTTALGAHQVIEQIYRPLVWIDRHGLPDFSRSLAASVDTPDDGMSFVVTLHDWRWSDGVPVTADDLLFTIDLIRRLGPNYAYYGTGGMPTLIAEATALSPHQVRLRMVRKVNPTWFVSMGMGNIFIPLPKHVFQKLSLVEMRSRQTDPRLFAVGDSAFTLKEYALGRHIVFEPNPLYGGQHAAIRRLIMEFPNGDQALEELRSGELDMANVPFLLTGLMNRLPGFRTIRLQPGFGYGDGYFNFHSKEAPFMADLAVRRAITRGINQQEIVDLVYHGQAAIDHGPVPASMPALQSDAARAGYPDLSFDPAAARAGLQADGWHPGADGIMVRGGRRLAFTIITSSESVSGTIQAQIIQRNLRAIGMDVSIHLIGFNQLLATLDGNGHDWALAVLLWSIESYPDVHDFFSTDGAENFGHFSDPRMDAINQAVMFGSGDGPVHAQQDFAAETVLHLYLPDGTPNVLARPGIEHVTDFLSPNGMWSPELLTLSGPLACPADTASVGGARAPHA